MGWYNGNEAYDFTSAVTQNIQLTAHWSKTIEIGLVDINGFITVYECIADDFDGIGLLFAPYLDGFTFQGWRIENTLYADTEEAREALCEIVHSSTCPESVMVTAVYDQKNGSSRLTVNNGTIQNTGETSADIRESELVIVNANEGPEDQYFLYWTRRNGVDEIVVSYNSSYSFYMPSDSLILTAWYGNALPDEQLGTAIIESVTADNENKKLIFVSVCNVPEIYTMVEGGLVATNDILIGENVNIGNALYFKVSDKTTPDTKNLKYTWTKSNVKDNETWYVKAYLLYRDTIGVDHPVYSDAVTGRI